MMFMAEHPELTAGLPVWVTIVLTLLGGGLASVGVRVFFPKLWSREAIAEVGIKEASIGKVSADTQKSIAESARELAESAMQAVEEQRRRSELNRRLMVALSDKVAAQAADLLTMGRLTENLRREVANCHQERAIAWKTLASKDETIAALNRDLAERGEVILTLKEMIAKNAAGQLDLEELDENGIPTGGGD